MSSPRRHCRGAPALESVFVRHCLSTASGAVCSLTVRLCHSKWTARLVVVSHGASTHVTTFGGMLRDPDQLMLRAAALRALL
eukprot:2894144-Amphidinium_carterae.1